MGKYRNTLNIRLIFGNACKRSIYTWPEMGLFYQGIAVLVSYFYRVFQRQLK